MADTTLSPNMGLPIPTVSEDPGPDWAQNINASLLGIDSHNHSAGSGVAITPDGISINEDLPFGNNNATSVRSVRCTSQSAVFSSSLDVSCYYVVGVDGYFRDGNGNNVRLTQGGSIAGAAGTITGLPSGTASASFSGGTFTFRAATNTPATMSIGPLIIARQVLNSPTIAINCDPAQASNYAISMPPSLPASLRYLTIDSTGAISYNATGSTGSGAIVLQTSATITTPTINGGTLNTPSIVTPNISAPVFSGVASGTIAAAAYTPSLNFPVGTWSLKGANYTRINDIITVSAIFTVQATAGGLASIGIELPISRASNFTTVYQVLGTISTKVFASGFANVEAIVGSATDAFINISGGASEIYQVAVIFTYSRV